MQYCFYLLNIVLSQLKHLLSQKNVALYKPTHLPFLLLFSKENNNKAQQLKHVLK